MRVTACNCAAEYDAKADVWSLAITAIELAVGEPPHANVHPMRAIFVIPVCAPPTLPDPDEWSGDFNDFLKVCLQTDPKARPSARELLMVRDTHTTAPHALVDSPHMFCCSYVPHSSPRSIRL